MDPKVVKSDLVLILQPPQAHHRPQSQRRHPPREPHSIHTEVHLQPSFPSTFYRSVQFSNCRSYDSHGRSEPAMSDQEHHMESHPRQPSQSPSMERQKIMWFSLRRGSRDRFSFNELRELMLKESKRKLCSLLLMLFA